jgi:hypothetical protein
MTMMYDVLSFTTLKFNKENTIVLTPKELVEKYNLTNKFDVYLISETGLCKVQSALTVDDLVKDKFVFEDFHIVCFAPYLSDLLSNNTKDYSSYILCKARPLQAYLREYLVKKHKEQAKFIAELLK